MKARHRPSASAWCYAHLGKIPGARTRIEINPRRWHSRMRAAILRALETGIMGGWSSASRRIVNQVFKKELKGAPRIIWTPIRYRRSGDESWSCSWDNAPGLNYQLHLAFAEIAKAHQVTDKLVTANSPESLKIRTILAGLDKQQGDSGYMYVDACYRELVHAVLLKYGSTNPEMRAVYDPLIERIRRDEVFVFELEEPATRPRKKKVKEPA